MRKSQAKKQTRLIVNFLNKNITKALGLTIALALIFFSLLLTVSKGQNLYSGGEIREEIDAAANLKNNLRNKSKTNFVDLSVLNDDLVSEKLFAPTAGDLDLSFNPSFTNYVGSIRTSALQTDGKLLIGGFFISINGIAKYNVARFNADGSLDASFTPKVSDGVYSIALQPDGKIIIGGVFTFVNDVSRNRIARLNSDGSLDSSFNPGGGTDNAIYSTALQSDGRIIIGGFFTSFNGSGRRNIARLNADGSLDTSFNDILSGYEGFTFNIVIQPDGKIIIGGNFFNSVSQDFFTVNRFNSDGSLDNSFTPFASGTARSVVLQTDGKILIGQSISSATNKRIFRLNSNGTTDTSFNVGSGANNTVWSINPLTNGKILIGGQFTTFNGISRNGIAQLNADGSLDTAFNPGTGVNTGGSIYTTKLLPSGKIFGGGFFIQYNGINRDIGVLLNPDGSLDLSFSLATLYQANIRAVVTQYDGKIIVGGTFNRINGQVRSNITRLNVDGTLDAGFNIGTGANGQIYTIALVYDGSGTDKIIIGGSFTTFNGVSRNRVARLNFDGSLDMTFNPGTGADGSISKIFFGNNGKYLIGGSFTSFNSVSRPGIARLNTDGTLDTTFNPTAVPPSSFFEGIGQQSDGKIIAGGQFSFGSYNSLVRLNSDGAVDNSFTPATLPNTGIYSLAVQDDDKIIIGGTFSGVNGAAQKNIARLNANGSLDTSFNVGAGTSEGDDIEDVVVLANGKILIGGLINSVNGIPRKNIARLNANGSLDTTFTANADNIIWDIEVPIDTLYGQGRKLYIGGDFFAVNGILRNGLAGLFIEPSSNRTRFDFDGDGKSDISVFRPSNGVWYLNQSTAGFTGAAFGFGTDKLAPADYDGDGKTDIAVFRDGTWYLLRSTLGFTAIQFGQSGDIPVPADNSDDGKADLIVFRPSNGYWYRLNSFDNSFSAIRWGQNGDIPISPADYYASEDGVTVFRPFDGTWYILEEGDSPRAIRWGQNGDLPVAGDYDGDGESDVAVFRNGIWYILQSSNNQLRAESFGLASDKPVPADYDGDGKTDIAVFRNGIWYLQRSSQGFTGVAFGASDDKPIPNSFIP